MPKSISCRGTDPQQASASLECFSNLAQACHDAGPLDEETRRLVKLAGR